MSDHIHSPFEKETVSARIVDYIAHGKRYRKEVKDYSCRCVHCGKLIYYPKAAVIMFSFASPLYVICFWLISHVISFYTNTPFMESPLNTIAAVLLLLFFYIPPFISLAKCSWQVVDPNNQGEGLAVLQHKEKQDKFNWRLVWAIAGVNIPLLILVEVFLHSIGQ